MKALEHEVDFIGLNVKADNYHTITFARCDAMSKPHRLANDTKQNEQEQYEILGQALRKRLYEWVEDVYRLEAR